MGRHAMTARRASLLALALVGAASAASAQSYTAPAGTTPAVTPGGLEGRAAVPNYRDAVAGRPLHPAHRRHHRHPGEGTPRPGEGTHPPGAR